MKIFGYEPAAWAGVLQGVLGALLVFNVVPGLTTETSTLIQVAAGALFALAMAFYTRKVNLAVVVGAAQALVACLVGFGLHLGSPDQTAALIAAVQLALAGFLRQNTQPAVDPGLNSEPLDSEPMEPEVDHAPVDVAPVSKAVLVPAESPTGHDGDGMPEEEPYV